MASEGGAAISAESKGEFGIVVDSDLGAAQKIPMNGVEEEVLVLGRAFPGGILHPKRSCVSEVREKTEGCEYVASLLFDYVRNFFEIVADSTAYLAHNITDETSDVIEQAPTRQCGRKVRIIWFCVAQISS